MVFGEIVRYIHLLFKNGERLFVTIAFKITGYNDFKQLYESAGAIVFRARREIDALPVIIKVINKDYPGSTERTRFFKEFSF